MCLHAQHLQYQRAQLCTAGETQLWSVDYDSSTWKSTAACLKRHGISWVSLNLSSSIYNQKTKSSQTCHVSPKGGKETCRQAVSLPELPLSTQAVTDSIGFCGDCPHSVIRVPWKKSHLCLMGQASCQRHHAKTPCTFPGIREQPASGQSAAWRSHCAARQSQPACERGLTLFCAQTTILSMKFTGKNNRCVSSLFSYKSI